MGFGVIGVVMSVSPGVSPGVSVEAEPAAAAEAAHWTRGGCGGAFFGGGPIGVFGVGVIRCRTDGGK